MTNFILATYCALVGVVLIGVVIVQHIRGTQELFCVRNIVILGFVIFQCSSPAIALYTGDFAQQPVFDQARAGMEFCVMMTVFLPIAFWAYRKGWFVTTLASKLPAPRRRLNDGGMLILATIMTVLGVALRFAVPASELAKLTGQVGFGPAALAVGLCAWVWARRVANLPVLVYMLVLLAANAATAMSGEFGRRGIVSIGAGLIFGVYFARWVHLPVRAQFKRLLLVSIPPILFVAAYTSVRDAREHDRTVGDHLREIASGAALGEGLFRLGAGQTCGPISMWLIENYPENHDHRHLMTIRYFFVFPIPRAWMEVVGLEKPVPMGILFPDLAGIHNVGTLNVGPGIIGHAACEGGWYALIIYALLAGLYLRLFDEYLFLHNRSAVVVLVIAAGTGQYLGVPRGETANMASVMYFIVAGTLLFAIPLTKLICDLGFVRREEDDFAGEADGWDAYGADPTIAQASARYGQRGFDRTAPGDEWATEYEYDDYGEGYTDPASPV